MINVTEEADEDSMELWPMSKPSYQIDGVFGQESDTEYDPDVERAEEQRREGKRDRRHRAASGMGTSGRSRILGL